MMGKEVSEIVFTILLVVWVVVTAIRLEVQDNRIETLKARVEEYSSLTDKLYEGQMLMLQDATERD